MKTAVSEIGGSSLANAGNCLFRVIGNSLEFPITQKGTNVPMMRIFLFIEILIWKMKV